MVTITFCLHLQCCCSVVENTKTRINLNDRWMLHSCVIKIKHPGLNLKHAEECSHSCLFYRGKRLWQIAVSGIATAGLALLVVVPLQTTVLVVTQGSSKLSPSVHIIVISLCILTAAAHYSWSLLVFIPPTARQWLSLYSAAVHHHTPHDLSTRNWNKPIHNKVRISELIYSNCDNQHISAWLFELTPAPQRLNLYFNKIIMVS